MPHVERLAPITLLEWKSVSYMVVLVVLSVSRSRVELKATTNEILHSDKEILIGSHLSPRANGEHARLGCH